MLVIPAIDIIDGKCVRLTKGDYGSKKEYSSDPLEVARTFEAAGLSRLHLVDLDGARQRRVVNLEVLQTICKETNLKVDFGGGVQSDDDLRAVMSAGAHQVTAGSVAVKNPQMLAQWVTHWGADRLILGADVINDQIATGAWQDTSEIMWRDFIKEKMGLGLQYVISTDIEKDGMLEGPSFELYHDMQAEFPELKIIASGGVSNLDDLKRLSKMGLYGAIVGKAYYEGQISLDELATLNEE